MISLSVVANEYSIPEVVNSHGGENNVGVVQLVVVADPGSDESPEGFHSWISTKSGNFLGFSCYKEMD
jgi:hypothetical protein